MDENEACGGNKDQSTGVWNPLLAQLVFCLLHSLLLPHLLHYQGAAPPVSFLN